jgi:hypothetical protein
MQYVLFILLSIGLTPFLARSQESASTEYGQFNVVYRDTINDVSYIETESGLFPGYENAGLIIDYFSTNGYSHGDRYKFEIIIIDSLLMVTFVAPGTDSFNEISYEKRTILSKKDVLNIQKRLEKAKLTLKWQGVPHPEFSCYGQEVILVRSKSLNLDGGAAWSSCGSEDEAADEISTNLAGDYRSVFNYLETYFKDLKKLMKKVRKD